jgi:hypothetical protein
LRNHSVWPRNKRRSNLLCRGTIRRLCRSVRRPRLAIRAYPSECSGGAAHCIWDGTTRAVFGQRDLGRSWAVRCLLRCVAGLSLLTHTF